MTSILLKTKKTEQIKPLVEAALEDEANLMEINIERTRKNLSRFEKKHKMNTSVFYRKMENGKLEDNMDFVGWAGEYETLKRLEKQLRSLKEIKVCK